MWQRLLHRSLTIVAAVSLAGCSPMGPADEVAVPLPVDGATARIQVWGNAASEGRFELLVETPQGAERLVLWEDWGPAQRASLYLTPDRRLVVLGGGGSAAMVALAAGAAPRSIPNPQRPRETGEDWIYLGAVDRNVDHLTFYAPSAQPECVPLYGAGSSPYRRAHQDKLSCAGLYR